jgi:hypothetical protein
MPVNPATQEPEIRRIVVHGWPGQKHDTYLNNNLKQRKMTVWLK